MINLQPNQHDDASFVGLAERLLKNLVHSYSPRDVYVIQIDHWFDHKWLHFSGKTVGAVGLWRSTLTVPPFDPKRVVSENHFRANSPDSYRLELVKPLHLDQWSGHNLHRFLRQVSSSGLFFWYSGGTKEINRGSMMVYIVEGEQTVTWYASLVKVEDWKLNKVKGVSRLQFEQMVA